MMKTYAAELVLLLAQLLVIYAVPLIAGPTDVIGMVFLMLAATLALAMILGWFSKAWIRFLWPFVVAAVFTPSVWIWYNSTALIHAVWYMVVSATGVLLGACLRKVAAWIRKKTPR